MDFSLTTFAKDGKLSQIEYALTRVQKGKMALGIKATNGVVLATDKKVNTVLFDQEGYAKMQSITPSTGFVYAGMGPDFRLVVKNARKNAQAYYLTYSEVQPVNMIVKDTAQLMQEYTQAGGVRPFGSSCLVAGYDDDGPQLFQVTCMYLLYFLLFVSPLPSTDSIQTLFSFSIISPSLCLLLTHSFSLSRPTHSRWIPLALASAGKRQRLGRTTSTRRVSLSEGMTTRWSSMMQCMLHF